MSSRPALWLGSAQRKGREADIEIRLEGKRAVVTAAGAGVGRAIAHALTDCGASVLVCDIDPASIEDAVRAPTPQLSAVQADVASPSDVARLFEAAQERLGGLDILVNNAAVAGPIGPVETMRPAELSRMMDVNLEGQFHCAREATPLLREAGGGSIVNMSSVAGRMGSPNRSAYAASKWGVVGMTKSLAIELGPANIRVNAICPGVLEGPATDRAIATIAENNGWDVNDVRAHFERQASLGGMGTAQDVANLVVFLASDLARRISGQVISVDGNMTSLA